MPAVLPPLHAILDLETAGQRGWRPVDLAMAYFDGGARFLQVRAKLAGSGALLALCEEVVALGSRYGATVIVNDRPDVARLSGAAGAHVGQEDLCPADARAVLGPDAVLGLSTHSVEQVALALTAPVTYVAVGPVFPTRTKHTGYDSVGLALVARAVSLAGPMPVVAIGGITLDTAPLVWRAGAAAVAVIGDLLEGRDPAARVASYNRLAIARPGG